jgi:hypothetical protein
MKYLYIMLAALSLQAVAGESCDSIWIYKPWKSGCESAKNGLDRSRARQEGPIRVDQMTGWMTAGHNQNDECQAVANRVAAQIQPSVQDAKIEGSVYDSSQKTNKDLAGQPSYQYNCAIKIVRIPYKDKGPGCGTEDNYRYQAGGDIPNQDGEAQCLSCDNLDKQDEIVSCLVSTAKNWEAINRDVPIHPDEVSKVVAQLNTMKDFERATPFMKVPDKKVLLQFLGQLSGQ